MFTEIAPGIYSVEHSTAEGKNTIVFGQRAALAVDVGLHPHEGQSLADFIREKGYEPNRVLLTHGHSDHVLGGAAFAEAEVLAPAKTPDVMRQQLKGFAERKGIDYQQILAQALWPTITFTDELHINLGDKQLHVFPTPGHSADCVSIYMPQDRVLIASDTVVTGIVPAIFWSSRALEQSLRHLLTIEADVLISGHGSVLYGAATIRDWLHWLIEYITSVRAAVLAAPADTHAEAIVDSIDYDRYIGNRLPKDRHKMSQRHRNTVMRLIYEEREA